MVTQLHNAMDAINKFLKWGRENGIEQSGIIAKEIPGRGIGIVAERDLKAGEEILKVPHRLLRCFGNTPKYIRDALPDCSTHGLLAAAICLDNSPSFAVWKATWPTFHDFDLILPIRWPLELQDLLPHSSKCTVEKQQRKFQRDWDKARVAFLHGFTRDQYMYAWLIVNTRSFYHTEPGREELIRSHRMCLQPVADLFNHTATGCHVHYDTSGYTIAAEKDTLAGEELYVRYGGHSNDTLLAEYGFIVPNQENPNDDTVIDAHLCTKFSVKQAELMKAANYWGDFVIDNDGPCYRTQVAARCLSTSERLWPTIFNGTRPETLDSRDASWWIHTSLRHYLKEVDNNVRIIDRSYDGEDKSREILRRRWMEIREFVNTNLNLLEIPGSDEWRKRKRTPTSPGSSKGSHRRKATPSSRLGTPSSKAASPSSQASSSSQVGSPSSQASPSPKATPASTAAATSTKSSA